MCREFLFLVIIQFQVVIGLHVDVVADALTLLVTGERGNEC